MASITTKFGIGDTFWTFNPSYGCFSRHVVLAIGIQSTGNIDFSPEISYYSVANSNTKIAEADCLSASEARELGNAWLADKSLSMFTSVGL